MESNSFFSNFISVRKFFLNKVRDLIAISAIKLNIKLKCVEPENFAKPLTKNNPIKSRRSLPKIIWIYWDSNPPTTVQYCISLVKKVNPEWDVRFLNSITIHDYIDIDYDELQARTHQQKSDVIRLELLYKYGGIWLDASVIVFSSFDIIKQKIENSQVDMLGFYRDINNIDDEKPFMENWFIASFKESDSLKVWKDEFIKALSMGVDKYIILIKNNNPQALGNLYDPYYLVCYVAFQNIVDNLSSYLIFDCDRNSFLYHITGGVRNTILKRNMWAKYNLIRNFFLHSKPNNLPFMVKLTGKERDVFERYITKGFYTKKSLAYHMMNIIRG